MEAKWLYETDSKNRYRFLLGKPLKNPIICMGINPSDASPEKLDRTLQNIETKTHCNGYDSWIMLNVYPQRAINPDNLNQIIDIGAFKQNLKTIDQIFRKYNAPVLACWGSNIEKRKYLMECLKSIADMSVHSNKKWLCLDVPFTKSGHPKHPLYNFHNTKFRIFDIGEYVRF